PIRALHEGEPETCRRDPRQFLPILAHLALLLAVFRVYQLEGRAFQILVTLTLAALPVHYLLPFRRKKPFFLLPSIPRLGWAFGPAAAAIVLAASAVLIGVCSLPIAWAARAAIVGALAAALALARAGSGAIALPESVWPVLGTMFMFRMVLYLYELKHAERP